MRSAGKKVRMENLPDCSSDVACGNGADENVVEMGLKGFW